MKVKNVHCVECAYLLMYRWCSQTKVHCWAAGLPSDVSPTCIHHLQLTYLSSHTSLHPQNHTQNLSRDNLLQPKKAEKPQNDNFFEFKKHSESDY